MKYKQGDQFKDSNNGIYTIYKVCKELESYSVKCGIGCCRIKDMTEEQINKFQKIN